MRRTASRFEALLDGVFREVVSAVSVGRKLDEAEAKAAIDGAPYIGEEAVKAKLADGAAYEDELPQRVARGGATPPFLDAQRYLPARTAMKLKVAFPVPFIGVIPVHGPIASAGGGVTFSSMAIDEKIIAAIRAARKNHRCLGVILHVDSPGGSALASDRIHHELEQLAKEKPLIACMGNVAASGGYYVAAPAHVIVAQPTTITGSIGVVGARIVVAPLLARIGVATEQLRRGAHAGLLDPTMPWGEEELEALRREIAVIYASFVDIVAKGRRRDRADIEKVAEGRVWTGADALTHGLVDRLGSFEDTVGLMRARVGAAHIEPRVVRGPKHSFPLNPPDARREAARALGDLARELGVDLAPLALGMSERVLAWSAVEGLEG